MNVNLTLLSSFIQSGLVQIVQYEETSWWFTYKYTCMGMPNAKLSEKSWIVFRMKYDADWKLLAKSFPKFSWQWSNEPRFSAVEVDVKWYEYHEQIA
jgi:hypothetical protein